MKSKAISVSIFTCVIYLSVYSLSAGAADFYENIYLQGNNEVNNSVNNSLPSTELTLGNLGRNAIGNSYTEVFEANSQIKVTNLADGDVSEHSSDVINGSQLFTEQQERTSGDDQTLNASKAYTDSRFSEINTANYNAALNETNARIDRLEQRVDRGLASAAALSGLFQPYNIGRFNFTAGIGGYRSQSAIAIGSGYRFNEVVAIKAGASTSTKSTSNITYNAAVNFEW